MAERDIRVTIPWGKVNATIRELNKLAPEVNVRMTSLAHEALQRLKQETPRSSGAGRHIADMWKAEYKKVGAVIREVIIRNDPTNELVLMCLEKGTRPHRIPRVGNKLLHFKVDGSEIFAQNVMHPGSRAFRFIELTRETLRTRVAALMKTVLASYAKRVARAK